jgi:hypothetical protein
MTNRAAIIMVICAASIWGVWAETGIEEKGEPAGGAQLESAQSKSGTQETIGSDSTAGSKVIIENRASQKAPQGLDRDDFVVKPLPLEPTRPIGKTIAGSVCTAIGGLLTISSTLITVLMAATGAPSEVYTITVVGIAGGVGLLVPGITLLAGSQRDWDTHKAWEKKYKPVSEKPVLGLRYTFDF